MRLLRVSSRILSLRGKLDVSLDPVSLFPYAKRSASRVTLLYAKKNEVTLKLGLSFPKTNFRGGSSVVWGGGGS